jgi:hypothetical protein
MHQPKQAEPRAWFATFARTTVTAVLTLKVASSFSSKLFCAHHLPEQPHQKEHERGYLKSAKQDDEWLLQQWGLFQFSTD